MATKDNKNTYSLLVILYITIAGDTIIVRLARIQFNKLNESKSNKILSRSCNYYLDIVFQILKQNKVRKFNDNIQKMFCTFTMTPDRSIYSSRIFLDLVFQPMRCICLSGEKEFITEIKLKMKTNETSEWYFCFIDFCHY